MDETPEKPPRGAQGCCGGRCRPRTSAYIPIPPGIAHLVGTRHQKNQVVIFAWDEVFGRHHITTWGNTDEHSRQAAEAGNRLKHLMEWPEGLNHSIPARCWKEEPDVAGYWWTDDGVNVRLELLIGVSPAGLMFKKNGIRVANFMRDMPEVRWLKQTMPERAPRNT